jgi:uncharacterized protein
MKRRLFVGGAFAGLSINRTFAAQQKVKAGDIPVITLGKTGRKVSVIAQGGARMDLHPTIQAAAEHVRQVYDLGLTYFDCARSYWQGRSEEAYGIGLQGVRNKVFLTSKSTQRSAKGAQEELDTSLRLLKTDHLDLWQMHDIRTQKEIDAIFAPGGAMETFEAAKKTGKCRLIGFTGHFDPDTHAAMLKSYTRWDTVMMPVHAADHAYLSFEKTALPVAKAMGIGVQAIKIFAKANLLRSLSSTECLRYALSQPGVHVAICGAGTQGQMEDNIRTAQSFKPMTAEEIAATQRKAVTGSGVYTGPTLEYWKKA